MIFTESLTKKYGGLIALDSLNLHVGQGEVFGLIGPNGAGKTTTLKILATLLRPTSGDVRIAGLKLAGNASKVRREIGYMPDFAGIYEDMRVDEYLHFFAAAAGIRGKKAVGIVRDVLELTDLTYKKEALVETLSRGMTQRLGLARVLLHDPKVLLLDEPASGLDPRARVEIRMLLRELCSMNKTIIISSHILPELAELCTTVGIIEQGRMLFKGDVREITRKCRRANVVHVRVEPSVGFVGGATERAHDFLLAHPAVESVTDLEGTLELELRESVTDFSDIPQLLVENGFSVHYFSEEPVSLEDAFMRLTKGVVQ